MFTLSSIQCVLLAMSISCRVPWHCN